eukprot:2242853-Rhodomonas_salina.4
MMETVADTKDHVFSAVVLWQVACQGIVSGIKQASSSAHLAPRYVHSILSLPAAGNTSGNPL